MSSSHKPVVSTDRFVLGQSLGEGGMGLVFEAFDREREATVAVKLIRTVSARGLLRFKSEFRLLRDLRHRNLVALGELFVDEQQPFFTMECVRGRSFLRWVRGADDEDDDEADPSCLEPRLRDAVAQLAEGLACLHAAGRVHRDVKPSNVLVEDSGRVVVLDFGLVTRADTRDETRGRIVGTHYYMAPEQGKDGAVGPAADCYAIGVMLYEALTGTLPFVGRPDHVLAQKRQSIPVRPRVLATDVAGDLDALCMELLSSDPAARPSAASVAARLRRRPVVGHAPPRPFVGRSAELTLLHAAFARARSDGALVVVEGESGIGKSELVARFVEELRGADANVLVLAGRCSQRETVPYRAMDGVVDDLRRHLATVDPAVASEWSELVDAVARVFAVFRRSGRDGAAAGRAVADAQEARAHAFAALRELLARVASDRRVVVVVEDVHWADHDGLSLLREILHPPATPPCLFVVTARPLPPEAPPAQMLLGLPLPLERILLRGLPVEHAVALARQLLATAHQDDEALAETLARETGGHPLFIAELARQDRAELRGSRAPLDDVLRRRIELCDEAARRVLEVVAVAGAPIARDALASAAPVTMAALGPLLTSLASANLLRADGDLVETFHDRIGEAVVAQLDDCARRDVNRRIAEALEARPHADHEALAAHWREAGADDKAVTHALAAAQQAEAALAFHRAARAYRLALALGGGADAPLLRLKLAEALSHAGLGTDAGRAFLDAAEGRDAAEALRLRARAADQFLRAGAIDDGVRVLRDVLAAVGLAWPKTPRAALWSLLCGRARVRMRGVRFRERAAAEIDAAALLRADVCLSAATGLGIVDTIRGAYFQTRHLQLALDAGEPSRVALSLGLEASFAAAGGGRTRARTARALAAGERLSARLGDPFIAGRLLGNGGIAAFLEGRWRAAFDYCVRGETIFREKLTGVSWERSTVQLFMLNSLAYLGDTKELGRRAAGYLRDAEQRGDLFAATNLSTGHVALAAIAADDAGGARARSAQALARWSREGWHIEHYYDLLAQCEADLYDGDGEVAYRRVSQHWNDVRKALLGRVQLIRINMLTLRMRAALACAAANDEPGRRAQAAADARRIARERMSWATPWARLAQAALATRGAAASPEALRLLLDAEEGFAGAAMQLHSAVARLRRGQLLGGDLGDELVRTADAALRALGVRRVDRIAALIAPGFVSFDQG